MNKIKELRLERNWKQDELGKILNVKRAAISKYENEHIPLTAETICILCDIFDVTADYLIGRTDEKKPFENKLPVFIDDLNEDEIKKVIEYIDFLKSKRNF